MTKDVWLKRVALVVLMTILTAISSATWAEENDSAVKALSLRNIMQELSNSMQIVIDAIYREDWEQVAGTAPQIANHPQFATLQKSCLACHQSFRKTFKEHFYGK